MANKLQINVDSTSLSHSGCLLRWKRVIIGEIENGASTGGYRESASPIKMVYGVGVHKFIDTMYKTGGHYPTAIKAGIDIYTKIPKIPDKRSEYYGDLNHLRTTCMGVWSHLEAEDVFEVLSLDDKPATEITFSIPYYEDENIVVNLCGTIDRVGKVKGGCFAIRDWKTTGTWDEKSYFKPYELSKQLHIYSLAIKLMSRLYPDSLLGRIGTTQVGCFIDAVFLKSNANENKIVPSDMIMIKSDELDKFELTLKSRLRSLSLASVENNFPKEGILNGSCEGRWGLCPFFNICSNDEVTGQVLLKRDFIQKPFDPLRYNEYENELT